MTVISTLSVTMTMVKSRYFPIRGKLIEVAGIISVRRRKNTVRATKIDMQSAIFSPEHNGLGFIMAWVSSREKSVPDSDGR